MRSKDRLWVKDVGGAALPSLAEYAQTGSWAATAALRRSTSRWATTRELSGRLHFLSVGRYAVKVRPLLVDNIRFRLVNKPGCQHEKIGACVPLTTIIGV